MKVGSAEAGIILSKGTSTAEAYKLEVAAMGREVFGQIRVIDKIAASNLKFIPDNLVLGGGGGEGNNLVNGLFGIALLEKLSGRSFTRCSRNRPGSARPMSRPRALFAPGQSHPRLP